MHVTRVTPMRLEYFSIITTVRLAETLKKEVSPEFTRQLRAVDAPEGTSVMLECHVTGVPPPSVSWQHNGDVIDASSPDYAMSQISGTCCLKIKRAAPHHAGQYKCTATNAAGTSTTSAPVNVICESVTVTRTITEIIDTRKRSLLLYASAAW